jgi:glycosyltransferase involved in cell wall biosynthesis
MIEISLTIPVYNASPFLDELFACLRALAPLPDEILLLDDASSDDSLRRLQAFAEASALPIPVRVLANERNAGIAGAYNRLAREARGEWIQVLDGDDVLVERDYFGRVRPALTADNDLVITGLESNSALLARGSRLFRQLVPRHPPAWWPLLGSFATRSGVIYRRQSVIEHPFADPMYPGSDVIHLLELRREARCVFIPRPRVFHRVHNKSQSSRSRDYSAYRRELVRYGLVTRMAYWLDITLRQLGHRWSRRQCPYRE